jgi:hypothetical protein
VGREKRAAVQEIFSHTVQSVLALQKNYDPLNIKMVLYPDEEVRSSVTVLGQDVSQESVVEDKKVKLLSRRFFCPFPQNLGQEADLLRSILKERTLHVKGPSLRRRHLRFPPRHVRFKTGS